MERRLGRPLGSEVSAKPLSWGNFLEGIVFEKLGLEYELHHKTRYAHPTIANWTGAPDTRKASVVGDIKNPFTMKSFCIHVDAFGSIEKFKEVDKGKWYWQLISNAILTGSDRAEIIIYCPYKKDLDDIRERAGMFDGDQNKVAFLNWSDDDELPWIPEGGHYKDLNIWEFDVPEEDRIFLTNRVIEANVIREKMENS